jgi:two-component system OmpR family response regulator
MTILLVEDDVELAQSLEARFRDNELSVVHKTDGESGLEAARNGDYEVIVLDRMLPGLSGLEFVRILRRESRTTPIIYLTTMDGIDDRVQGLEAGGDDYLVKPFAFAELLARVRAAARRAQSSTRVSVGALELDLVRRSVARAGRCVDLLPQEFRLLEYLMRHADRVVTRRMLLENVWDIHFDPHTSVVESHVSRLRARLNQGSEPDMIQTVRGVGYRLLAH